MIRRWHMLPAAWQWAAVILAWAIIFSVAYAASTALHQTPTPPALPV